MSNHSSVKPANVLLLMPSFYGCITWIPTSILYLVHLINWNAPAPITLIVILVCAVLYLIASLSLYPYYSRWLRCVRAQLAATGVPSVRKALKYMVLLLHAIGFLGLFLYIYTFSNALGGYDRFFALLVSQSYVVRWESQFTESIGTQLSYFGWIAASATGSLYALGRVRWFWLVLLAAQVLGNCLFIGRTRPIWMILTILIGMVPLLRPLTIRATLGIVIVSTAGFLLLFLAMGIWVGKIGDDIVVDRNSPLPPNLQNIYMYATGGFAYLDQILVTEDWPTLTIERTAYPLMRVLGLLKITAMPPSQVCEFLNLPYEFNVGTALEPFYRDAGTFGVVVGVLLITIGADIGCLWCWQTNTWFGWFAAANLCFASAMSFSTPKFSSFPVWLFVAFAILTFVSSIGKVFHRRIVSVPFLRYLSVMVPEKKNITSPVKRILDDDGRHHNRASSSGRYQFFN